MSLLKKTGAGVLAFLVVFALGVGIGLRYSDAAASSAFQPLTDLHDRLTGGPTHVVGVGAAAPQDISEEIDFARFWEVWRDIRSRYYEQPVSEKDLLYGAIRGMVESTGDPYTSFFEPKEAELFLDDLSGEFSGIGAEIGVRDGELQVVAPLPGSPAEAAGIRARDLIIEIDGKPSLGMTVEEAVINIRGPKGSTVTLKLGRVNEAVKDGPSGILEEHEVRIVRDTIVIQSVSHREAEPGIHVVDIRSFNADTEEAFINAIDEIREAGTIRGLIVDLRNDPGGYLDVAVGIAGEWLEDAVVVQQRERGTVSEQYHGNGRGFLKGIKTVVLVNEGSASASEIVAGALQDAGVATLVGTQTFGKGSVQEYQEYDDGSALKVTVAEWLTPNGRSINHEGITPDVEIPLTETDANEGNDPQLKKALELIRTGQAKP